MIYPFTLPSKQRTMDFFLKGTENAVKKVTLASQIRSLLDEDKRVSCQQP